MSRRRRATVEDESDKEEPSDSGEEEGDDTEGDKPDIPIETPANGLVDPPTSPKQHSETGKSPKVIKAKEGFKRDPAVVPRRGQFFLHDDRAGRGGVDRRAPFRKGKGGDDDFDWKHDKFEELASVNQEQVKKPTTNKAPRDQKAEKVSNNNTKPREENQMSKHQESPNQRSGGEAVTRDHQHHPSDVPRGRAEHQVPKAAHIETDKVNGRGSGRALGRGGREGREGREGGREGRARGDGRGRGGRASGRGPPKEGRLVYSTGVHMSDLQRGVDAPPGLPLAPLNPTALEFQPTSLTPSPTVQSTQVEEVQQSGEIDPNSLPEPPALEAVRVVEVTPHYAVEAPNLIPSPPIPPAIPVIVPPEEYVMDESYDPAYGVPMYDPNSFMYMQDPMYLSAMQGEGVWYPDVGNMYMGDMYYIPQMPMMQSQMPAGFVYRGGGGRGRGGRGRGRGRGGRGASPVDFSPAT